MRRHRTVWVAALMVPVLWAPLAAAAQATVEDYRRAAGLRDQLEPLTVGLVDGPNWMDEAHRFWYRVTVDGGARFVVVDAATAGKEPAFDHEALAAALSAVAGEAYTAVTLPFYTFDPVAGENAVEVDANGSRFHCTLAPSACRRIGESQGGDQPPRRGFGGGGFGRGFEPDTSTLVPSPDSSLVAFIHNHNVAVRPLDDPEAEPTLLSREGSEGDAYELRSLTWSPDSRKLVAYRRRPGYPRLVHFVRSSPTGQLQPVHETTSSLAGPCLDEPCRTYQKPGDVLDHNQPVLFDVVSGRQTLIDTSLFPNPYRISRPEWREDSRAYTFEYNQRGHQRYRVLEVDGATGAVRTVIEETSPTFISYRESTPGLRDTGHIWRHDIDDGREILWMSERDGWSHLYLYDGVTGQVKNQVTRGPWVVKYVDSVDVANRQIHFRAMGMNPGQDPYFVHHYRIGFDGTGLVAYTEGDGDHTIEWSPDRRYYVDTWSRVDLPPVVELRRGSDGGRVMELERGDMSALLATGWTPPEVFVSKGRDGSTDIWGIIVRPVTFDPGKRYPVVESIYAGPQGSFVPKTWGGGMNFLSLAEVGFVVVQIDGMGTNNRSKAFHDVAWRDLGDAGFPDRIRWHRAVAQRYSWYDVSRVGLYGGSAGGQNAMGGVLFHGDFYAAAFASSGCHDNRMDKIWWNEQWMGWPLGPHYEASSNVVHAHRLAGKLFLAVGEMDTNVDPASTMQVVDALVRAGKSFELLVVPNGGHGALGRNGSRKRIDFFVKSLMGLNPPDWNRIGDEGELAGDPGFGALDWPEDDAPPYGFFESEVDSRPPYTWW